MSMSVQVPIREIFGGATSRNMTMFVMEIQGSQ